MSCFQVKSSQPFHHPLSSSYEVLSFWPLHAATAIFFKVTFKIMCNEKLSLTADFLNCHHYFITYYHHLLVHAIIFMIQGDLQNPQFT